MIIIVEGIDRVGKTTLVNKLKESTGFPVFKHDGSFFDYSKMDNMNETDKMVQLLEFAKVTNKPSVIFDRFHASDFVYGSLERGYNEKEAECNFNRIEFAMQGLQVAFVLVNPTDIEWSSKQHGKDLKLHQASFRSIFEKSKIQYKYECTFLTIDETVEKIVADLEEIA